MTAPEPGRARGDLIWEVMGSFVGYVRAVGGEVAVIAPATQAADGRFRFPLVAVDARGAAFAGGIRFTAHGGALALEILEPWIVEVTDAPHLRKLTIRGSRATNTEGGRLPFAELRPGQPPSLTAEAMLAFDYRYPAGTPLAPLDFVRGPDERERNLDEPSARHAG